MASVLAGTAPEGRNRLLLIAAAAFAAIAAVLVFVALQERAGGGTARDVPAAGATNMVVVAARDVPANTRLTAAMLEVRAVPANAVLSGAYEDAGGLVGLATRYPLAAGEQVTALKVGVNRIEDEDDVSLVLPAGKRGFAVRVTEVTGAGGLLLPGNFVDVIAVFPNGPTTGNPEQPARIKAVTLLQDVEVLAVGQEAQRPLPALADGEAGLAEGQSVSGQSGRRAGDAERQPDAQSATLAVTPEQAQQLALVQETGGVIWLSLRPAGDHEKADTDDATLDPFTR
jgi:pilus assembly protein CpaB